MTVIDLIIKLQNLPPKLDVLMDVTRDESEMFKFIEVMDAGVISLEDTGGGDVVVLTDKDYLQI
jgi:hypothetical protein